MRLLNLCRAYNPIQHLLNGHSVQIQTESLLSHSDDKHLNSLFVQERGLLPKQFRFCFHLNEYVHRHQDIQLSVALPFLIAQV